MKIDIQITNMYIIRMNVLLNPRRRGIRKQF